MESIVRNKPNDVYHEKDGYVSSSIIKNCYSSMMDYEYNLHNPTSSSDAMKFGNVCHKLLLEYNDFSSEYAIMDDTAIVSRIIKKRPAIVNARATNEYKALVKEFHNANEGREVISINDYRLAEKMCTNVRANPHVKSLGLFMGGDSEVSIYSTNECKKKIRTDWVDFDRKIVADYKTCQNPRMEGFGRDYWRSPRHYDLSAAMYLDVLKEVTGDEFTYYFVASGKDLACECCVYLVGEGAYKRGKHKYDIGLKKYLSYQENKTIIHQDVIVLD